MSISKVFKYYEDLPMRVRLHVRGRWGLCPFKGVAAHLPKRGRLVDIGSGYGIWPFYINSLHPEMEIWALEVDLTKVQVAKQIAERHAIRRVEFVASPAQHAEYPPCQVATILDVLYLIPWEEQEQILNKVCAALEPGGTLLVKEIGETPAWKYAWNWFEEWLAVRVLKITQGNRFYFRTNEGWAHLFNSLGLDVEIVRLDRGYPHSHVLFVCLKKP